MLTATRPTETLHPAIRFEIPATKTAPTESGYGFFRMRDWQRQCFDELQDSHHWLINAPMAAGKSFEICALVAHWLMRDPALRVIIAVPPTIISEGFREKKIEFPDGRRINWAVDSRNDLCLKSSSSNTAQLRRFLTNREVCGLTERVVLCSHATLVRAFARVPEAFSEVLVVIDEAHHIKQGGDEPDAALGNQMGALVSHGLANPEHIRIGLATATFFRGDAVSIVSDLSQFKRFDLGYDEYLATCSYLRSFSYDFIVEPNFVEPLRRLFHERLGKTIVYIPPVNSRFSVGNKKADVDAVIRAIAATDTPTLDHIERPIMRVRRGDKWVKLVNLVDERLREEKRRAIAAAHKDVGGGEIDVIIALGMLKEGANWRHADREIIIGQRDSLTEIVQLIGRLFRDVEGKTHVEAYHLLPLSFDQMDKAGVRESLNDYLKAILLSMLLENVIEPAISPSPRERNGAPPDAKARRNFLREALPDDGESASVLSEIVERVLDSIADNESLRQTQALRDPFFIIVGEVLSSHGVKDFHEEIAEQVLRMFNRRTVRLNRLNVDDVDVNVIKESPFDCLLRYGSDVCGATTFRELREACRARIHRPLEQARTFVRSLSMRTADDWRQYCASELKPNDIPSNPNVVYKDRGWAGMGDWLGRGRAGKRVFLPFSEAKAYVDRLGLKYGREWEEYCKSGKKPSNIPANPQSVYKGEWTGIGDWLGTGNIGSVARHQMFRPFEDARAFAQALGLGSKRQWYDYCQSGNRPPDIPANPLKVYRRSGWKGFGDWLGTSAKRGRPGKDILAA